MVAPEFLSTASTVDDPQRGNVCAYQNGSGLHRDTESPDPIPSQPADGSVTLAAWVKRDDMSVGDFTGVLVLRQSGDYPLMMMTVNKNVSGGGYVERDWAER